MIANIVFPAISHQFMMTMVTAQYSVLLAAVILAVETFFIKKILNIGVFVSFLFSFLVNLVSSFVGVMLTAVLFGRSGSGIFGYSNMRLGTYIGLIPGYMLTVVIEWLILFFLVKAADKNVRAGTVFKSSLIMNFFSYCVIFLGVAAADLITKGEIFNRI